MICRSVTQHSRDTPQFYLTAPSPCPYLPGRQERKVFTHLVGDRAPQLNDVLTQGGFRRSQNIAYRPACENCRACVSTRVVTRNFVLMRPFRRILRANTDVIVNEIPAHPTSEQYALFRSYLDHRHSEGGMADMSVLDYGLMIEDTHVETLLIEYRLPATQAGQPGELIGCALTDVLSDGLSMVYSFYDAENCAHRSLGTFMVLDHIARTRRLALPYLYLGYWVEGSRKMAYKARFAPQEHLGSSGWTTHRKTTGNRS